MTWTDLADWRTNRLFPVTERLMQHKNQPYSGDLRKSMRQACIRLMASEPDKQMAEITYNSIVMEQS